MLFLFLNFSVPLFAAIPNKNNSKVYTFSSGLIDLSDDQDLSNDEFISKIVLKGSSDQPRGLIGNTTIVEIYLDGELFKSIGVTEQSSVEVEIPSGKYINILVRQGRLSADQLQFETSKI